MSALPHRTLCKLHRQSGEFRFSVNNLIAVILELTDPAAVFYNNSIAGCLWSMYRKQDIPVGYVQ